MFENRIRLRKNLLSSFMIYSSKTAGFTTRVSRLSYYNNHRHGYHECSRLVSAESKDLTSIRSQQRGTSLVNF